MNKINIALTIVLITVLSVYAHQGVQGHKLKVDCNKQSLDQCVLYAIPLKEGV